MQAGSAALVKRKHVVLVAASALIAGVLYLGTAIFAGLDDVASAWRKAGAVCVAAVLMSSLCNVVLRYLRWQFFLRLLGHRLPVSVHLPIYLAGFSLTTVPGKVGELIRSVFLQEHGVPYSKSIAAFLADRLSDLLGMLMIAAVLSWLIFPAARFLTALAVGLAVTLAVFRFAGVPVVVRLLRFSPSSWRVDSKLAGFVAVFESLRACLSLPAFGFAMLMAILAFSAQALALVFIVDRLAPAAPLEVFLAFILSTLGGAASMLPGGLGAMEATLVALLSQSGVPLPAAAAATVILRLGTLWFVVALGTCCLVWMQLRHDGPGRTGGTQS